MKKLLVALVLLVLGNAAALEAVKSLRKQGGETGVGACVVKHTNPCGVATASTLEEAYRRLGEA